MTTLASCTSRKSWVSQKTPQLLSEYDLHAWFVDYADLVAQLDRCLLSRLRRRQPQAHRRAGPAASQAQSYHGD